MMPTNPLDYGNDRDPDNPLNQMDRINQMALGPLYVPRDPNPLAAGAGLTSGVTPGINSVRQAWDALGVDHAMYENNGTITLSKIVVPPEARNQGIGSQAMQQLTDYADATGQRIALTPSKDFGATSVSRLTDFYKGLGFKPNKGRSRDFTTMESMIRDPQETEPQGQGDK